MPTRYLSDDCRAGRIGKVCVGVSCLVGKIYIISASESWYLTIIAMALAAAIGGDYVLPKVQSKVLYICSRRAWARIDIGVRNHSSAVRVLLNFRAGISAATYER